MKVCQNCGAEYPDDVTICSKCYSHRLEAEPQEMIEMREHPGMTKCRTCGETISETAEACPHCGEVLPGLQATCPQCGGHKFVVRKAGFSWGKALMLGPLLGFIDKGKIVLHCQSCEQEWKP